MLYIFGYLLALDLETPRFQEIGEHLRQGGFELAKKTIHMEGLQKTLIIVLLPDSVY